MKKLFLFSLLMAGVFTSQAQIRFGARAGLNVANITGQDVEGYRSKAGLHFGGFANLALTPQLSVQGELMYSSQGARWDDDNEKTALNYLQIPVLVKYQIVRGLYAEAGPQIGFLLKAEDDNEGDVTNIKEFLEKTDVSIAVGGGYNINSNIGVYARYNASLSKFYDEEKNSVFQLGVSYTFGKAGK